MQEEIWLTDEVFTVDGFLSPVECQGYVAMSEDVGFEAAVVSTSSGMRRVESLRNNERVMFRSLDIAEKLWERASDFVPVEVEGRRAIGVNEMIRVYRYDPGQQFNWHQDFAYERDNGEVSRLTLLVYLNDGFEGGETSFDDSYSDEAFEEFKVTPQTGKALFFLHPVQHKGEIVQSGRKYVLRTDVMYSALDEGLEHAEWPQDD